MKDVGKMVPVPALRDELFEEYDRHNGPLKFVMKGHPSLYVISENDLFGNEPYCPVEDLVEIDAGFEGLENSRERNAFEALEEISFRYGT